MLDKQAISKQILGFIRLSERLKSELRHSWLSGGRQESVADHCWHMALLALLLHDHLDTKIDLLKTLTMILVHDLSESIVGDIPFTAPAEQREGKYARELAAMEEIKAALPADTGDLVHRLWVEFEEGKTLEAKFARALDNLEVQIQHNFADLGTWEDQEFDLVYTKMDKYCVHDRFLNAFCGAVKEAAEDRMKEFGIDPELVKARIKR